MEFKEVYDLPIDSRIVKQSAQATIRNLVDAAVELITNCDDSYRRLEEQGFKTSGRIELAVSRQKGGRCETFLVRDYAEGMTREELQKAVRFGGETSGFEKGRTVRGLFGRGLKEAIISLGEGEIYTIKNNTLNPAKIWWDENEKKAKYGLGEEVLSPSTEHRIGIKEGNGTVLQINVKNEKMRIPEYNKFKQQISDHYALRDITSSQKREVFLQFVDLKRGLLISPGPQSNVKFESPQGEKLYEGELDLPGYGDRIKIEIFKSPVPLDSPRLNPFAKAGLLVKSGASVLDNCLFKYENDPAALYFWGKASCDGIVERIRRGEVGIIDFNRAGIEWRHEYCQAIQATIEKILDPLIQEKRKELERKEEKKEVAEPTKKMLRKLCNVLNELANKEFEEWESPAEEPPPPRIKELTILPRFANIELDKPRPFSIYAPPELVRVAGNKVMLDSDNINISLLSSHVSLDKKHPKDPNLYYGIFKVVGRVNNEEATIRGKLVEQEAVAHVKVAKLKPRPPVKPRGFISDILPDEVADPIQRVEYVKDTGEIKIKIRFPSVARYLRSGLEGSETEQGKVFLAELVGEAFCRQLAVIKLERGETSPFPGAEIDFFNSTVNELQKKYLDRIHEVVVVAGWKFK
jgi:hypothetical protein